MANVAAAAVTPVRRVLVARTVVHFFVIFYIYHYHYNSVSFAVRRVAFCGFPCALLRVAAKRRGSVAAGGLRPQLAGDRWWGGPAVNSG